MTKFIPFLAEEAIERDAAALLAEYAKARGIAIVPPIPIEDIVEKHLKLGIEFDDTHKLFSVPRSGLNPDILGAIFFDDRRIVIDESLDPEENPAREGRYRFTLAHEGGGHWRLHRYLFAKDPAQAFMFGGRGMPSVVCRSSQTKERVEWQADFHASCLLMPRKPVFEAWRREFGTYDSLVFEPTKHAVTMTRPTWNGPRLIGEITSKIAEPDYVHFFEQIAKRFSPMFRVSHQAMRIRLEKLGLLLREVPRQRILASDA
jgi:Zn-dependent peptidase ImmA (M78 family)